jgi:hypothetical protein
MEFTDNVHRPQLHGVIHQSHVVGHIGIAQVYDLLTEHYRYYLDGIILQPSEVFDTHDAERVRKTMGPLFRDTMCYHCKPEGSHLADMKHNKTSLKYYCLGLLA